jgi:Rps23 Pro-64 3,4-dihydroxylase Tpa1-like proline 4-hydroxylase
VCDFKTGAGSLEPPEKVETIRGAVVIYYLMNEGWQPGDGGETGLFTGRDPGSLAARRPPLNNSLVAFECTPTSFHAFLANRRPRTSIIMWVHRTVEEAVERYGEEQIERWQL